VHAFIQTGAIGDVIFLVALLFAGIHLIGITKNLEQFPNADKQLLIGSAGN
jgi:hypothetical protein